MDDDNLQDQLATPVNRRFFPLRFSSNGIARTLCLAIANLSVLALIRLFYHRAPLELHWELQVFIAYTVLFISGFVAVHQWLYWSRPSKRLLRLLPLVRRGHEPIETLGKVRGGLTDLALEVQQLFQELRSQKAHVSQMQLELSQRVASRTDALERSLGAMRQQASRDALTGLFNRRVLDETLPVILHRCRTANLPMSLMMIDIDNFKTLNDTLGHAAGDELLRSIGQLFRSTLLEGDAAYRYGGDEFVVVLPEVSPQEAKSRAHQVAKLVVAVARPLPVANPPRLSSGLISLAAAPLADADTFLREADRLLYRLKASRRNRRSSDSVRVAS